MPSPFPGMDPWLEESGVFPSLHSALIYLILEALNAQLPDNYLATTDRMVAVAADPILEPWEQSHLEILSNHGERLVTAIEILSPSNKKFGDNGRTSYLQKQGEFRLANVNLIEIDLLRGGAHTTAIPIERLRSIASVFDYHICTTVIGDPTRHHVKAFAMRDALPTIVVPLDPGTPAVKVKLQPLFDRAYDTGRYIRLAKYDRKTPEPTLTPEQQQWADTILNGRN